MEDFENEEYDEEYDDEDYDSGYDPMTAERFAQQHPGEDPANYEAEFQNYDELNKASIDFRVNRKLSGQPPEVAAEIAKRSHPSEVDPDWVRGNRVAKEIERQRANAERHRRDGDISKAVDCEGRVKYLTKELEEIAAPRLEKEEKTMRKAISTDASGVLDPYIKSPKKWMEKVDSLGEEKAANDAEALCAKINANSDENSIYMVLGHSKEGRSGFPSVHKIQVSKEVAEEIKYIIRCNRELSIYDCVKRSSAGWNVPDPDAPQQTQAEYEATRPKPRYISPMAGANNFRR